MPDVPLPDERTAATLAEVEAHVPTDDREAASCGQVVAALRDLGRPFDREAQATHLTGSAVVVGRRGVLLHLHKRLGMWLQPGGHIDPGEWPAEAARREAQEETGVPTRHPAGGPVLWHVDVHPAGGHLHLDLRYLLEADDLDPAPPAGESPHVAWFPLPEALALSDGSLRPALERLRSRRP
ncbi:MAG TPA: NUDIX domain-containing protein [Acidimicrobiales bacterium]|nr:NUDIX domain-containing protein [Acidimicrobiales bacterium]